VVFSIEIKSYSHSLNMQLLLDMSIHIMTMPTVNMHVLSSKICAHMLINDELFLYITC